ncbi:MAG: SufD family Fe-S cluster assembly protein [Bacilli bacterium]|nr:SufD family Fe-S cluster assembly protein [Bacilli bacterium]
MNKLVIKDNITSDFNDSLYIKTYDNECIKKITVDVLKKTKLYIELDVSDSKINVEINVKKNVDFKLFEIKKGERLKIQYVYNLEEKAKMFVFKFNNTSLIKERSIFNLNEKAKLEYNFKTIVTTLEEYDYLVNHKGIKSKSDLYLNGVSKEEGKLSFNITGEVLKYITGCEINEESRIITLNDNECIIKPNLLIEEYDVIANHSSLIGGFSNEELFYLMSRGISEDEATYLLIKGFLLSNIEVFKGKKGMIEKIINKYWR